ncbi:heavy metal translocating P-type ATPase [Flavimaricola marinus]|uniref:P-type Cu(+) transporter n=1 Tax=Flavimaricola marinus TaxID=1819565 RepID=A0A238LBA0_9RHOB|nr:heavy metal translocating P-type ATPase [Flavimaricola marinus]SMY06908.1 Copper-transporting P-type ATPase [Flavimaricola marinus]
MTQHFNLSLDGMSCASCVARVDRALHAVPGVSEVNVNLATETARVTTDGEIGPLVDALETAGYPARIKQLDVSVEGMTCAGCAGRAKKGLSAVPGVIEADVNLATERARIRYVEGQVDVSDLVAAAKAAGYPLRLERSEPEVDRKADEAQALARQTWIAAALTLPVFVVEMGGHLFPPFHHLIAQTIGTQTSWVIQFVLVSIVLAGPGRQFYAKGYPSLFRLAPDMNSLVALGTSAAYLFSVVATFAPGLLSEGTRAVYFEAAAVIVVLILLGRTLEARAKGRTGAAIRKLAGLRPKTARVIRDGVEADIPVADVVVGDVLALRPGDRVAVDGQVRSGASFIDESMLSGEPIPVEKAEGDTVIGGTINGNGALTYAATHVGADTVLAQIVRMVEDAQGARLPIQALVDKITLWFVPAVMALAALTVLVWVVIGPSPALGFALVAGVSVLIIACPCAMGLATPTSIMVGTGRAAELGVLFRKGEALQALTGVSTVAMDKTGTLTVGRPDLADLRVEPEFDEAQALAILASAEAGSEHPVAGAIQRAAAAKGVTKPKATSFEAIPGFGVQAMIDGQTVLVGAERLMQRERIALPDVSDLAAMGRSPMFLALDGRLVATFTVSDQIKPGSAAAVKALQDLGLKVAMITGDGETTAQAVAAELGIDEVIAGVLPDGKVAAIERLQSGGRVAFVGDGINDAPALARADVGIAIGTGTDVAIETADVVLMSGEMGGVINAFAISRATMRNIRQNLIWAFGYNVALIPVAAGALYPLNGTLLSPMLAAGAMALSSVFVLSNALRLRWVTA